MTVHDDHRRGDDAHLLSLRLALGTILSPKRPQMTRSNTTSGTASPSNHCPHSAIPLSPSHSNSGSHPAPSPIPPIPNPTVAHPHHAHHHPLRTEHHQPHHSGNEQPAMPGVETAHLHPAHDPHPQAPDAVAGAGAPGNMTPGARTHFLEALQSKSKSWDAMIHGSWV
ncbi:hypothetical protein BD309DRAFT_993453 [Dichomitus squalens]|nr:hypothetical protein BD309DRAFT_993453 [Dichomitus squalens]